MRLKTEKRPVRGISFADHPASTTVAFDEMTLLTIGLYLLAFAATATVWLVWQY